MGFLELMTWPFLACLVLAGIHCYLGLHVIEREIIFVDLALAQIAVLGCTTAMLVGFEHDGRAAYWLSLVFTLIGAAVFALSRFREQKIPQEALIGIVYAVAAATMVMFLSRSGEGDEHLREALVGNVLLVTPGEVIRIALTYACVGLFHFIFRKKFLMVSRFPEQAFYEGYRVRLWDFIFYALFGLVVTSSVRVAGVLLVFSLLVIPACVAVLFAASIRMRLMISWLVGAAGSFLGIAFSYFGDFPTGASVVCALALLLIVAGGVFQLRRR